jgi:putative ABC transport system permease protein
MTAAGLAALWSHWRRNPLQLFTLVAGLALATALWSGVQALNAQARSSYDAAAAVLGEGQFDQLVPRVGDTIPRDTYLALRESGWLVSPVLEGALQADDARIRIVGVDIPSVPRWAGSDAQDQRADSPRQDRDVIFAHPGIVDALAGITEYPVIANPDMAPDTAMTDISVVETLLDRPDALTRLVVARVQPLGLPDIATVAPDLVRRAARQSSDIDQLTDSFHLNLTAFGLLSFAVGIFIVHGAIGLAFEQRRAMVRTLRTLGLSLRRIMLLMALELLALAVIAGALGVAMGYALAATLLPDVAATLEGLYGAQVAGVLQLDPAWWLSGLGIALAGAVLAGAGAFWTIARMPILATGSRAWAVASGQRRGWQGILAVVLVGLAGFGPVLGGGLLAGFASLACLLLGAALALPLVLDGLLALGERRAQGVRTQWFLADTRQQLPGLRLALMALLLAMAANIGVSTMVSSFRLTFTGFLDQRLFADLYVETDDAAQGAALQRIVADRTRAVLPIQWVDTQVAGQQAEIYGARVAPAYAENWQFIARDGSVWDRVAAGEAAIINEQLARRADLWPGDGVTLSPGRTLPIAGVVGDYGNPIGQVVIGEPLFQRLFPDVAPERFGLVTDDPDGLRAVLETELGLSQGQITDQAALKAFSLDVFERTFTVTAALNVLTLSVAGFAILMSLLTLAAMRVPQLAPAWALGMTRRSLGRLEVLRAVVLAALTLLVALPLGLALAWMLLAVINVEAFGWRLPMYLFPGDYAVLGGLSVLAALLAALWPARRLARTPPSDLLKVFANEG